MSHTYRVTLERLDAPTSADVRSLSFEVGNHDEILGLIDRVAARGAVPAAEAAEFTVGLKLFSEVMLRHRQDTLFAELLPHFGVFMKRLKSGGPDTAART